jgi:hypothetical protein
MAPDLLEQLAEVEVPPPPATFDTQLHDKVNRTLVATQFADLLVSGFPWAIAQFCRALLGLFAFTVTGRYEAKSKRRKR